MKKPYELPALRTIGSVQSLTQQNKCGGSGDSFQPQMIQPWTTDACPPSP
jgi:hypothetical protein